MQPRVICSDRPTDDLSDYKGDAQSPNEPAPWQPPPRLIVVRNWERNNQQHGDGMLCFSLPRDKEPLANPLLQMAPEAIYELGPSCELIRGSKIKISNFQNWSNTAGTGPSFTRATYKYSLAKHGCASTQRVHYGEALRRKEGSNYRSVLLCYCTEYYCLFFRPARLPDDLRRNI